MFNTLSGRFLILTTLFVMLAEILIFVPSVARFRADYLQDRLERAQIASLALLADDMIAPELEAELLENAEVYNVVLRRDEMRELMLSSTPPDAVTTDFDLREANAMVLIRDAMMRLFNPTPEVIRVIGDPVREGGLVIEITMWTSKLRAAMIDYGVNILLLSAVISVITALLLFLAVQSLIVRPIKGVVGNMKAYAADPEDARRIIAPATSVTELREAEVTLRSLQTDLTGALKQKERLAQLGGAVARISHDLRNVLTTAQLFADRMETSEDPLVKRVGPKLMNSISRAVSLCENTLAFGKAEEPAPTMNRFNLAELTADIIESERLSAGDHDLSFAEDIPAGLNLRADPEQLYRVLSNLVRNARQAIVASGKPGEIALQASETETDWLIRVVDTGPGLPKSSRDHLFQPFAGTSRKGGSGLGMAISAELVRGHGGTLELERTDETGTTFVITLPRAIAD
ncbi:Signal transduction histidine kinase [Aliiroseovarius halocynthiae]|uniref:histidine kinase n=1 Tax=Aliiroseovarius halocynthiae TaxID=985055 RepID=A0A545SXV2_9RHOB|nr:HAMP domain-containing sensor histidine kinase [Aliiroseovarius halocynthiae]TQV69792.1 HAMP domain-containing histidine kinase [Aliiroseovarius halocynthiae]SMR81747.1 Signal transduction histidine kinase [Aliiroseovarius halocynthiae]